MFDKMKALMDMQKKMQELKTQLDLTTFEVESSNKRLKIAMNGSQEVKDVKIDTNLAQQCSLEELAGMIKDTVNKAIKRSQELAAEKMKSITGLNLPGLL